MKRFFVSAVVVVLCVLAGASAMLAQQSTRPFTIDELLKVRRVGDPQVSPDGRTVAYQIGVVDRAANRTLTQIYLVPIEGGSPRQLTTGDKSSVSPRWSPDGKKVAFISGRDGTPQIWTIDVAGGALQKVTNISTGAGDPIWSPDGSMLAFVSDVYPECTTDECNKKREQEAEESKVKAKVATRLLFRHWTSFKEGKRTHVFVVPASGGLARDVTTGDYDAPPFSLGGPTDYAFSPDSKELAFVRNTDKVEAASTNSDLFIVPVTGGEPKRLTGSNQGADASPVYSPDGRYLAYRSQATATFESDRFRLMLYDRQTGQSRSISESLDSNVEGFTFSPDSKKIYFVAAERGREPIYSIGVNGGAITKLVNEGFNDDVHVTADGSTFVFSRSTGARPTEIYRSRADGSGVAQVTQTNDVLMNEFKLQPLEEVTWTGGADTKVSGFIAKPVNFSPAKKWSLLVLIHGGPQGAWNDAWGYRWNPQVFAAAGYVVFMPNPRGSTGYGQKFVNEISGDWGGKAFTDIMNGVAHMLSLGYADKENIGAAGGSYGGYMVDWIEGHNTDPRFQFKALASHAGVYNLTSMYGATEEIWFPEWEFKGNPWDNPELYTKWSPHLYAKNFKTPMLVIHGELDYRVPVGEGLQLFTTLQRRGVESKLLYFPDEGHWIMKPQNSTLWYNTVLDWFDTHLKPGGRTQQTADSRP
jgi:dipeptidyl aminopeptidase/acylaminoacyl peptidase